MADLANLRLTSEEIDRMAQDLDEILTHMDKLDELDTGDVEPMAQVLFEAGETASLRADVEHTPLGTEVALANAALKGSGQTAPKESNNDLCGYLHGGRAVSGVPLVHTLVLPSSSPKPRSTDGLMACR